MVNLAVTRGSLIALAFVSACQHPAEPPAQVKPAAATATAQPVEKNEGEERAEAVGARRIGMAAPALVVKTIDGQTIDLAKLYGDKPVYLKFWATWCIPCRAQMPGFERTYEALGDRITVLSVNTGIDDDEASVRAFRDQFGLRMPVVVDDGRLAAALDLQVTPQHVLIGRDARIAYVGHVDGERLDAAIQTLIKAPAPAARATPAVATRGAFRPGDVVQGLEVKTTDGATVAIGGRRDGRPHAVVLFSAFCESYDGIKANRPQMIETCRHVREELGPLVAQGEIDWLGVAHSVWTDAGDVAEFKTKAKLQFPMALDADGAVFRAFGVHHLPTVALIAADGRLVRLVGPEDRDLAEAVHALGARR
jgi:peroxiredoxin